MPTRRWAGTRQRSKRATTWLVADLDLDGFDEIVVADADQRLAAYRATAVGIVPWQVTPPSCPEGGAGPSGLTAADVDLDGEVEVLAGCSDAVLAYRDWFGAGPRGTVLVTRPQATSPRDEGYTTDGWGTSIAVADVDCDRRPDVVVGRPWARGPRGDDAGSIMIYPGGDEDAAPQVVLVPQRGLEESGFGIAVAAADLDGDGCSELAVLAPGPDPDHAGAGAVYIVGRHQGEIGLLRRVALPADVQGFPNERSVTVTRDGPLARDRLVIPFDGSPGLGVFHVRQDPEQRTYEGWLE